MLGTRESISPVLIFSRRIAASFSWNGTREPTSIVTSMKAAPPGSALICRVLPECIRAQSRTLLCNAEPTRPGGRMLNTDAQTTLSILRWQWDKAYAINGDGKIWTAIPAVAPEVVLIQG